jgi:hypothetical protein
MTESWEDEADPQVVADLLAVERGCGLLGAAGARAEFWEVFTLLKISRDDLRSEFERLDRVRSEGRPAQVDPLIAEKLRSLRGQFGPVARALRTYLSRVAPDLDSLRADLALVLFMGSAKGRAAADRWTAAPDTSVAEAALRVRVMGKLVDAYRAALLESRRAAAPPVDAPAAVESRPSPTAVRLRPRLVEDLVLAASVRELLLPLEPHLTWEFWYLLLTDGDLVRPALEELGPLKRGGKPGEFAGAAYNVRQRLQHARAQVGDLVRSVRTYLEGVCGSWTAGTDDLAVTLLVAEEEGRHRARQWLADPQLCKGEAVAAMNGLRSRARLHLEASARP